MATQTTSQKKAPKSTRVQAYVNQQLDQTRRRVKTTDLITRLIMGALVLLAALQVLAIIDAWVWSFGSVGRWVCFGLICLGAILFVGFSIAPLFLRRIHPDYAARMIEDARPTFKNSLLNYVSLRKKPEQTHAAIMDAVSKQAALDLQTVPEDATVDQSGIIKSGLLLLGVICFAVMYWLVSPKDPLQSFSRILLPSIKQSAPSVVQITDVTPGDQEVFFGDSIEIGATIKGNFNDSDVRLFYSTADGQLVDQSLPMQAESQTSKRFSAVLPFDQGGIQQSLVYHVAARDGQSPDYDLIVKANPSIAVESAIVMPPAYTRLPEETLTNQQSIEAPEGSRVRLVAKANLPIKLAYIELLTKRATPDGADDFRVVESINMKTDESDEQMATGEFLAVLNSNRTAARASHYRLKFVSTSDDRNANANTMPIRVIADLAPEIEVLNPAQNQIKLPVNETLLIDARAFDSDYGISSIELKMDNKGSSVFPVKKLPLTSEQGNSRVRANLLFTPEKYFLQSGDTAVFTLTANDNRVSHLSGMLDANSVQSRQYQIEITDAVANPKRPQSPSDPDQNKNGERDGDPSQQSDANGDSGESQSAGAGDRDGDGEGEGEPSDGDPNETGSDQPQPAESSQDGAESTENQEPSQQENGSTDEQQTGSGSESSESPDQTEQSQTSEDSGAEGSGMSQPSDSNNGNSQPQNGNSDGTPSPDSGQPDGQSEGQQSGDGNVPSDGSNSPSAGGESGNQPDGAASGDPGNASDGDPSGENGGQTSSDESGQPQNQPEDKPLSPNATDGEIMERLQQRAEQARQEEERASEGAGDGSSREPTDNADASEQNTGSGKDPEQKNPRTGEGSGSMQKDDAQAAEEGAQNKAERGDGSPNSSQGAQDGDAKGASGSKTGDQSNQGASSDDSKTGESNESGGNEAGKSEQDSGKKRNAEEAENGEAGKSNEGGAKASKESGENGGDQKPGGESEEAGESGGEGGEAGESGEAGAGEAGAGGEGEGGEGAGGEGEGGEGEGGEGAGGEGAGGEGAEGQGGQPAEGGSGSGEGEGKATSDKGKGSSVSGSGGRDSQIIAEKENLANSKKATDMVLNRLEQERYDPDPELLKDLNWTKEDLNNFVDRWQKMKQKAEAGNDPAARRRYDQAIKSLGLNHDSSSRKVVRAKDNKNGFNTDSAVNRPPPKIAPAFKTYLRDRNRADR